MRGLFVIVDFGAGGCMLLGLEPRTMPEAIRAIRWQWTGGAHEPMHICRYDETTGDFVAIDSSDKNFPQGGGQHFKPLRGCLTERAWGEFLARLPGNTLPGN